MKEQATIENNKYGFKVGDRVRIDEGRPNSCEVVILRFTVTEMFVAVKSDDGYEWETMTNRLTPIQKQATENNNKRAKI